MVTSNSSEDILRAALALPPADRLKIADDLLASVPPPPGTLREGDPGFIEELERRSAALRSGEDPGVDAFEALQKIENDLDRATTKP